jgi:UDP:flavonoid glycosyltransferase YjiC (YdhE family)
MPASGYMAVPSLDASYASAGYYHPGRIVLQLEKDRKAISRMQPDLVITHMEPTAVIAARLEGVPVVSIADADFLEAGPVSWMPWIEDKKARLTPYPPSTPAFNRILQEVGLPLISDVSDLLCTDLVLVASTPELEPVSAKCSHRGTVHYVGPLIWDPGGDDVAHRLAEFGSCDDPHIYVTLGSGEVAATTLIETSMRLAQTARCFLFIATGYAIQVRNSEGVANRVRLHSFGGIRAALRWADAVICHGGHSTILACLLEGKPMVIVPGMSENEANARLMVARTETGFLLYHTELDSKTGRLRIIQRYPDLPSQSVLNTENLLCALNELLLNSRYTINAQRKAKQLQPWLQEGARRIVSLVNEVAALS